MSTLIKKGDADGALAGLFRLRKQHPSAQKGAEIATLIGTCIRSQVVDRCAQGVSLRPAPRPARQERQHAGRQYRPHPGDRGTYWRARRLLIDYVGRSALPSLKSAARSGPTPRSRNAAARLVLDTLEGKGARRAKR